MEVRLLGPLEAGPESAPVRIAAAKPRTLLAVLALEPGRAVSLDALTDALWPDGPPPSAGKLLQTYISQLRRAGLPLVTRTPGYLLDAAPEQVDAVRFAQLVEAGQQAPPERAAKLLADAVALWRGEPLCDVGPAPVLDAAIARLSELRLRALEGLFAARLELGEASQLIPALQDLAGQHPLREALQEALVLALYQTGRQADALAAYERTRTLLRDELGLDPGPALRRLHERLLRQEPGLSPQRPRLSYLPTPLTPTVGRADAVAELVDLLADPARRLLTLTGPGGSGKTRLATVVAQQLEHRYRDGAALVALEAVRDPALVLSAVAAALGVRESGEGASAALVRELTGRQLLVVLDNLEQAVAAGPELAELLAALPDLTLLVTSRVLLAVRGEHAYPVAPLAADPAVELFCDRARAALGAFAPDPADLATLTELCARLDRLPLAIELAAAQSRTRTPGQLLDRLQSRLEAPGPGQRDRPDRHRSLRSALEGSYELLSPPARRLFAALSVCAGGFDLPAVEAVGGAAAESLAELVDHSLVQVSTDHRFAMLETIRELAAEKLADPLVAGRHSAYFLALAEEAGADLDGPRQAERLAQLDRERDNLHAAFGALRRAGDAAGELRLAVALARFWYIRGHLRESRQRLSEALEGAGSLPAQLQADALRKVSATAYSLGDYAEALTLAEKALALHDEMGDALGRARSLSNIGAMAHASGDHARAAASLDEAIELATELGAERVLALALNNRGDLGLTLGNYDEACRLFEASRVLLEAQGDRTSVARSLLNLALSALGRSAYDEAAELLPRSLALCVELGDAEDIAWCLLARAALGSQRGEGESAAVLLGAAETVLREIDAVQPYERSLHQATVQALNEALGEPAFERSRALGAGLALPDAVALART